MKKSTAEKEIKKMPLKDIEVNKDTANDVVNTTSKILKIIYILILISGVYVLTLIVKEWNVLGTIGTILKILSPFFIGLVLAWLLDPIVTKLTKKGMHRALATAIVFVVFVGIIILIIATMIPMLWNQINDFIVTLPGVINELLGWLENVFSKLTSSEIYDFTSTKQDIFETIRTFGVNITTKLPDTIITVIKALVSGLGVTVIGLLIGLYLLLDFDNATKGLLNLFPKTWRKTTLEILHEINTSLRSYIQGLLTISSVLFVVTSLAFWAIGLEAPLLFGLIVGITNIIPYVGPYIGGAPAALVGFAQSPATGILAIVVMFIAQFLEGNILQPIIMGKTMKLHPVVIIIGLLVFGSLFGIVGMILATPIIATFKVIIVYLDEKYDIIKWIDLKRK